MTFDLMQLLFEYKVSTVCQEAACPNIAHCFRNKKLTFMILGDTCTRDCRFCAVAKANDLNLTIDEDEPYRISGLVKRLGLDYVVITSVSRDDLPDGGAAQFAKTIESIYNINRNIKIETLIPDFKGSISSLKTVITASPGVVAHNIETVKRLYKDLRPKASYGLSLEVLSNIKKEDVRLTTKSSIMLGLGEREEEVTRTMEDLKYSHCDILTLGQYLAPSKKHYPVKEFIGREQFMRYKGIGLGLGFKAVLSGPLVRSSYQAAEVYKELAATSYS